MRQIDEMGGNDRPAKRPRRVRVGREWNGDFQVEIVKTRTAGRVLYLLVLLMFGIAAAGWASGDGAHVSQVLDIVKAVALVLVGGFLRDRGT